MVRTRKIGLFLENEEWKSDRAEVPRQKEKML